jgi:hypothetical protein
VWIRDRRELLRAGYRDGSGEIDVWGSAVDVMLLSDILLQMRFGQGKMALESTIRTRSRRSVSPRTCSSRKDWSRE